MANFVTIQQSWKNANYSQLKIELDALANDIATKTESVDEARRCLVDKSRDFKLNTPEEVRKVVAPLLKSFQSTIDLLCKRNKEMETAFLSIYRKLIDLPDPQIAIERATEMQREKQQEQSDEKRSWREREDELNRQLEAAEQRACSLTQSAESCKAELQEIRAKYEASLSSKSSSRISEIEMFAADCETTNERTTPVECVTQMRAKSGAQTVEKQDFDDAVDPEKLTRVEIESQVKDKRITQLIEEVQRLQSALSRASASAPEESIAKKTSALQELETRLDCLKDYDQAQMRRDLQMLKAIDSGEDSVADAVAENSNGNGTELTRRSIEQLLLLKNKQLQNELIQAQDGENQDDDELQVSASAADRNASAESKSDSAGQLHNDIEQSLALAVSNSDEPLDTVEIATRIRQVLLENNIGQRVFAKYVLSLSQGTLSELISKPKKWDKLTEKGRESYRKMVSWLGAVEENVAKLKLLLPKRNPLFSGLPTQTELPATTTTQTASAGGSLSAGTPISAKTRAFGLPSGNSNGSGSPTATTTATVVAPPATNGSVSLPGTPSAATNGGESAAVSTEMRVMQILENVRREMQRQQSLEKASAALVSCALASKLSEAGSPRARVDAFNAATSATTGQSQQSSAPLDHELRLVRRVYIEELTKLVQRAAETGNKKDHSEYQRQLEQALDAEMRSNAADSPRSSPLPQRSNANGHPQGLQLTSFGAPATSQSPSAERILKDVLLHSALAGLDTRAVAPPPPPAQTVALDWNAQLAQLSTFLFGKALQTDALKSAFALLNGGHSTPLADTTSTAASVSLLGLDATTTNPTFALQAGASGRSRSTSRSRSHSPTVEQQDTPLNLTITPRSSRKAEKAVSASSNIGVISNRFAVAASQSNSNSNGGSRTPSVANGCERDTHGSAPNYAALRAALPPISVELQERYSTLNTEDVVARVKQVLNAHSISQRLFGEHVLGLSQGSVSDLLSRPKPFAQLTQKGKEPFVRMQLFLESDDQLRSLIAKQARTGVRDAVPISDAKPFSLPLSHAATNLVNADSRSPSPVSVTAASPPPPLFSAFDTTLPTQVFAALNSSAASSTSLNGASNKPVTTSPPLTISNSDELDTSTLTSHVRDLLASHNLGQKLFGEYVLSLSQGSVSEILSKPKPWSVLSAKGREPYVKMRCWLDDSHGIEKLKQYQAELRLRRFGKGDLSRSCSNEQSLSNDSPNKKRPKLADTTALLPGVKLENASDGHGSSSISASTRHTSLAPSVSTKSSAFARANSQSASQQIVNVGSGTAGSSARRSARNNRRRAKGHRVIFSEEQKEVLNRMFEDDPYPSQEQIHALAKRVGVTVRTVVNWFHNHRVRSKHYRLIKEAHQFRRKHGFPLAQIGSGHVDSPNDAASSSTLLNETESGSNRYERESANAGADVDADGDAEADDLDAESSTQNAFAGNFQPDDTRSCASSTIEREENENENEDEAECADCRVKDRSCAEHEHNLPEKRLDQCEIVHVNDAASLNYQLTQTKNKRKRAQPHYLGNLRNPKQLRNGAQSHKSQAQSRENDWSDEDEFAATEKSNGGLEEQTSVQGSTNDIDDWQ